MRILHIFNKDERGAVGVMMAITIVIVLGFVAFGVDVGLLREKRAHLQKAADIAALAAGEQLVVQGAANLDEVTDDAVSYGRANLDSNDVPSAALQNGDVTFYLDGSPDTTTPNQVEVAIYRTTARGNSLSTIFGSVLSIDEFDVRAFSRVEVASVCSSKCFKPFSAPDKFTFTDVDGDGVLDVDSEEEMSSIVVEGYSENDLGAQILLKFGNPQNTLVPGQTNAIDLPPINKGTPITGASAYRENIASCEGSNSVATVEVGDELLLEPGEMIGPTKQGLSDLIALDPGASWSTTENTIINSAYSNPLNSPRVVLIAFYNPLLPPQSGRNTVFVNFLGAVFVEGLQGNDVVGRFIRAIAVQPDPGGDGDCLLYSLKFVKDSSRQ